MRHLIGLAIATMLGAVSASAADWMQFRGPGGSAHSDDKGIPDKWSGTENIAWKTKLPGPGSSCPITVGDSIYLTCYTGYGIDAKEPGDQKDLMRHFICLDRKSGAIRWTKDIKPELPESAYKGGNDAQHGYASSTPVSDGKHVFVFFGKTGVFCFDLTGEQVWSTNVGKGTTGWGSATSPVLYKDLVIVNAAVESGAMLALKQSDGKEAWKFPGTGGAWGSPMLVQGPDGKTVVVLSLAGKTGKIVGVDPDTGKKVWSCEGNNDGYVCTSVISNDGVIYAIGGRVNHSVAVKAGGQGDVTPIWTSKLDSRVNSPIYHEGHLYWLNEQKGQAYCLDAATGKEVYAERLPGVGNAYASGVFADGKIYYLTNTGTTFVVAAKPKYELIATNKLDDTARTNASPVVDNGRLLIRTDKYLYCVGKK
ncbi:MAG TPA: PQQ-binding-like beta-propeller repeat protein [Gemmataceae bacterium]|nr:PQQ-binding-like beta-propeller repeat protein [Gemmataceae bacterium]